MSESKTVSRQAAIVMLILAGAIVVLMTWIAQERYMAEEQRDCMSSLSRPHEWESDYAQREFSYANGVRECLTDE